MKFRIVEGDITEQNVDAIVNAANTDIQMGGGVAEAIRLAAGEAVQKEAKKKAPIELGEATWTDGYDLEADYVIHAATMELGGSASPDIIRCSTRRALELADELDCKSVTLPALGCGTGGIDLGEGARYIFEEIRDYEPTTLEEVRVIGYGEESYRTLCEARNSLNEEW